MPRRLGDRGVAGIANSTRREALIWNEADSFQLDGVPGSYGCPAAATYSATRVSISSSTEMILSTR